MFSVYIFNSIKNKLGLCSCKWCLKKPDYGLEIPLAEYKGLIYKKHLEILKEYADMNKINIKKFM